MKLLSRALLCALALFASPFCLPAQTPAPNSPSRFEDIYGHPLPPQRHTTVFGQGIAFYDMGPRDSKQPTLVLVHGYGSQADVDFGPSLVALAKHRRVIALDQIGAGRSAKPFVEYRVQTYVDFLAEFLRVTGVSRFDLLGESLGGWVVAAYAEQAMVAGSAMPRPNRLILEDAAGFTVPQGTATPQAAPMKMTVSTVDEVVAGLRAVFFDPTRITPEVAKRRLVSKLEANDGFAAATFSSNSAVKNEAVGAKASTIAIPTLVLWGAEDKTVPVAMAHAYADAIPGAKLVLIPRSGHVPSLEQPEAFVGALQDFLR